MKGSFVEQFTDNWQKRWKVSKAKKESGDDEVFSYVGEWKVEEPIVNKGMEGQKGLVLKSVAAHHAISAAFDKPLDNTDKTLVIQYEVKLQDGLECGGAYLKLLTESAQGIQAEEFSDKTPYTIMFGPDKCGSTNKVHFIFRHKNPITGEYEEKHLMAPPVARTATKESVLYTLIIRPNQEFEILIDDETAKKGSLLEDFKPAVNPEKEIADPDDKKPSDWVDTPRIPDLDVTKPEDWDEDAPKEIDDPSAEKPEDWLDDEPLLIPDPEAEIPADWDEDEDGTWVAPKIQNPKCLEVSGCGVWKRPKIANPNFKGKWTAPLMDNPDYKGPWEPRKIPNPDYFTDNTPSNFEKMAGIGFELWTMQANIMFNNIYIGHSEKDAKKFAKETWHVKNNVEKELANADKAAKQKASEVTTSFKDSPIEFVKSQVLGFIFAASQDPIAAFKADPLTGGGLVAAAFTVIALLGGISGLLFTSSKPAVTEKGPETKKEKEPVVEEKKEKTEAEVTGNDGDSSTTTKRKTTRRASEE